MSDRSSGLTIKHVAERTGVSLPTLRAWERRYGVPKPKRGQQSHYRLYNDEDIADVLWIKRQVEVGLSPSEASRMLREGGRVATMLDATKHAPAQPVEQLQLVLQSALLDSDLSAAQQALDDALARFTPEQVAHHIIAPTMRVIGECWQRTEIGVWQEHLASNFMRQRLLAIFQALPHAPTHAPRLVAACAPEEQHELGLLTFALLARRQGWAVTYLGLRTPYLELLKSERVVRPQIMALSASTTVGLTSMIPLVSERLHLTTPLVFGGTLFNRVPILREHVPGTYMGTDASEALHLLATSTPHPRVWTTPTRLLPVVQALQANRLALAAETAERINSLRARRASVHTHTLEEVTLLLIDTLACALAFDAHDLLDAESQWLCETLPPRGVPLAFIVQHLDAFERTAHARLTTAQSRIVKPLLARMRAHITEQGTDT